MLVPVGVVEDTVLHPPQRWQACGRWGARDQWPSARNSGAIRAGSALDPRAARAGAIRAGSARSSRAAGAGSCGASPRRQGGRLSWGLRALGGDQVSHVWVDVVYGLVVVVGVVHLHLQDAGGDAPHRLEVRLRGLPAPLPLSCALPFPPRLRAPSCLPAVVHIIPPFLAPGPPPCPWPLALVHPLPPALMPVSCIPSSVARVFASPAAAGAPVLLVPLPVCVAVPFVPPSAARTLAFPVRLPSPAAACTGALPVPLPLSAAASALALPLCPSICAVARAFAHP